MFYSETLLSKTGPLARVWLSANLERKLSKSQILQSDIENSVHAIVDQGQAPMALRLSGQLLLGVVRIYSRKTRYLLDDCNEALMKIKMAFRLTNNNDLPGAVPLPPGGLTLPDVLTESDLFMNLDTSVLFSQPLNLQLEKRPPATSDWSTQLLPDSNISQGPKSVEQPQLEDDTGLILDLGDDADVTLGNDTSIEVGRNAPAPRPVGEDLFSEDNRLLDDDLDLDLGEDAGPLPKKGPEDIFNVNEDEEPAVPQTEDVTMGGMEELGVPIADESTVIPDVRHYERDSESHLSSVRSSMLRDMEESTVHEDAVAAQHHQRIKRRKLLQPDVDTVLTNQQIKQQQNNREGILKPVSLLPRDPVLLTLMSMQKNGDFVSTVKSGGASFWTPELRDMLSIESVRKAGLLKRKRDSGIADMDIDGGEKVPRLNVDGEEEVLHADEGVGLTADSGLNISSEIDLPADDGAQVHGREEALSEDEGVGHHVDNYDNTVETIHTTDTGPVSIGTKRAVHILRDQFGDAQSTRKTASVCFQDLIPEGQSTKSDATKMFFEILVLATKDAIKVEQNNDRIGSRLNIHAKQGLCGSWAETETGGEARSGTTEVAP
ncbi:hypothetical protein VTO42DRAFT_8652 [Malbranchea cinnamomea]